MRKLYLALLVSTVANVSMAQQETRLDDHAVVEEIIVVTGAIRTTTAETTLPINVLSGEKLRRAVSNSLGETLEGQVGVTTASFGTGVGLPVIRGQQLNRVQVLKNSVPLVDVSNASQDHNNAIEPILAERIEVLRGPATLLYGSGAIGGVVNVIDGRIAESPFEKPEFVLEHSYLDNGEENKTVFKANASIGNVTLHADGFYRENDDDFEIPGLARIIREEAHDEDHDEDHEEEEFNSRGFIANSRGEAKGINAGLSVQLDNGYFGFSVGELDNEYGLPPGGHGHHEEEHAEGEEEEEEHEEEEGPVFVRLDMEQTSYDFAGALSFDDAFITEIRATLNYTDYEHRELEIEEGMVSTGTIYSNEGFQGRVTASHRHVGDLEGVWGLQFSDTEFSAVGEEGFIPETDTRDIGLFAVERLEMGRANWEFGARVERRDVDPGGRCDTREWAYSTSAAMLYDFTEQDNLLVSLSRSERAPSVEELFSNIASPSCGVNTDLVTHAATSLIEIGDPNLDTEVANNLELGWRHTSENWSASVSAYYNQISDFIYLQLTGEEEDETDIAVYRQEDADFHGIEGEVTVPLFSSDSTIFTATLSGDYVVAELDRGGDVPRIPPARLGLALQLYQDSWTARVNVQEVFEQDDVAVNETKTDGYTRLGFYADYHWPLGGGGEVMVFLRGDNLLDEEIRHHTSFIKDEATAPGRSYRIGLRYTY